MLFNISLHIIPAILLSFVTHLILHEAGHLLGGLLTGWQFLYLQLFNLAVVKGKKWLSIKSVSLINSQCIMNPRCINLNPYLYTLGGCLLNLFTSVISLILIILNNNIYIKLYSWSSFVMGAGFFLMNGVPRVKHICNDMACYLLLKKDSLTRQCHNAQLMAAKQLYDGCTYKQIDRELLSLPAYEAYNDILAYQAILEYYCYLDIGDSRGQIRALEKINNERVLSDCIKSYVYVERIYVSLISLIKSYKHISDKHKHDRLVELADYEKTQLDELESFLIKDFLKGDVHMERIKVAYYIYKELANGDIAGAKKRIIKGIDYIEHMGCIYSGEKDFCIRQLKKIKELLK